MKQYTATFFLLDFRNGSVVLDNHFQKKTLMTNNGLMGLKKDGRCVFDTVELQPATQILTIDA